MNKGGGTLLLTVSSLDAYNISENLWNEMTNFTPVVPQ